LRWYSLIDGNWGSIIPIDPGLPVRQMRVML
jgi:hypothetical protein